MKIALNDYHYNKYNGIIQDLIDQGLFDKEYILREMLDRIDEFVIEDFFKDLMKANQISFDEDEMTITIED